MMEILIGCLLFRSFTGSEMYVFELSKNLVKLGLDVTVTSPNLGEPLISIAKENGIKICDLKNLDKNKKYDLIHCQHTPIVEYLINLYPNTKKVSTIHSEVISLENPILHHSIKKYIAIRPEIKELLINIFKLKDDNIEVIYNPVDNSRFFKKETKDHNSVLFVGTIDYLRKNTIYDLADYTKSIGRDLWLIGDNTDYYLSDVMKNKHVKYLPSVKDIEKYTQSCNETAGILLGRTTIEGWMCGKSGWIYNIDNKGNILSKSLNDPPKDIEKFYSSNVAKRVNEIYNNIL